MLGIPCIVLDEGLMKVRTVPSCAYSVVQYLHESYAMGATHFSFRSKNESGVLVCSTP